MRVYGLCRSDRSSVVYLKKHGESAKVVVNNDRGNEAASTDPHTQSALSFHCSSGRHCARLHGHSQVLGGTRSDGPALMTARR